MKEFSDMVQEDYGIKKKGITSRNPQANAILERVHLVIGNMIETFQIYGREDLDEQDPWSGILSAVMFGVRSTYHTSLEATPAQLVFGRDMILPIQHQADWKYIKEKKQKLIDYNNKRENRKRKTFEFKVNDEVLISRAKKFKHGDRECDGPYTILEVGNNGTLRIDKGNYSDTVNIRNCYPYFS